MISGCSFGEIFSTSDLTFLKSFNEYFPPVMPFAVLNIIAGSLWCYYAMKTHTQTNTIGIHALVARAFPSCPASQSFGIKMKVNMISKENRIFTLGLYEEDSFEGG